jgi:fermentation-respiration switch protein FrsA (DUF1100 family)
MWFIILMAVIQLIVLSTVLDLKRFFSHLNKAGKLGPDTEIVIQGTPMGGATVIMLSGEDLPRNVKAIIEGCGYTSVKDIFSYQIKQQMPLFPTFPTVDISSIECMLRAGYVTVRQALWNK